MNITPRSTIGTPEPPSDRYKLPSSTRSLLVHYTGSPNYGNHSKTGLQEAKEIAKYGVSAGKSWEYNYMVSWDGGIFEQAGGYKGAHCSNWNEESYGILFILGVEIPPTQEQINAFWWLEDWLITNKKLQSNHEKVPHYRYRATICPNTELAEHPGNTWNSPTGEGSQGDLLPFLLNRPVEEDDMPTEAQFKQWMRDVANEWAVVGSNGTYQNTVQNFVNAINSTFNEVKVTQKMLEDEASAQES